jgi:putative ATPase
VDLFAESRKANLGRAAPLAVRMRPRTIDEFTGQQHILGPGKLLRRMLEADRINSVLFYGPPGTGKTTLAQLIASYIRCHFEQINAASSGVKEVRAVLDAARHRLESGGSKTVLFIDEIHRFNKSQQDILLPDVEAGYVILAGATTENPFFSVNAPLLSRSQIFQFAALTEDDILTLLRRAIADPDRGFGKLTLHVSDEALAHWAKISDGDARRALTALEIAVKSQQSAAAPAEQITITLDTAEQSIQQKAIVYDGTGDEHYDAASALIKSMRGSDPDAAVYWVARMLAAGEDPRFIARRIAILASEDIGNADPQALVIAAAACQVVERIGMPECQLTLGQAAIYMAMAPKSNASAQAIWQAMADVKLNRTVPVPVHLKDGHYEGSKRLGHGKGYVNPHENPDAATDQDYLGVDVQYYRPTPRGFEAELARRLGPRPRPDNESNEP